MAAVPDGPSAAAGDRDVPAITGLRAVAVIAVIAYHLCEDRTWWFRGGWAGVDVFFVLSGYLVTSICLRTDAAYGAFLARRLARLLPALVLMLVASLLLVIVAPPLLGRTVGAAFTASENVWASRGGAPVPGLGHLWSLTIEWQFYLVWPLVVMGVRRRALPAVTGGLMLLSAAYPLVAYQGSADRPLVYFGTLTHVVALTAGALVAQIPAGSGARWAPAVRLASWAGLLGIVLLMGDDEGKYRFGAAATALTAAGLLFAYTRSTSSSRALTVRPLLWMGSRSYGIYLWQLPVLVTLAYEDLAIRLVGVLATAALAEISYRLLETPVRRWARRRLVARDLPPPSASDARGSRLAIPPGASR